MLQDYVFATLACCSSSDKLYIAAKIAGYVYVKEPLQNLILSLTNSVTEHEQVLLDNLFIMYDQYVIYNYRGILEALNPLADDSALGDHLRQFYKRVIDTYERYFKRLSDMPQLTELEGNPLITRYLNFYEQAMYNQMYAETQRTGLMSLFKSVDVKSLNWAIRRPDEKVHQPQPLGHFETSAEFPMGERLNPTFQERLRRHYQTLTRDEIDID